jgi:hypothetical protein
MPETEVKMKHQTNSNGTIRTTAGALHSYSIERTASKQLKGNCCISIWWATIGLVCNLGKMRLATTVFKRSQQTSLIGV